MKNPGFILLISKIFTIIFCLSILFALQPEASGIETVIIQVQFRDADELIPIIKGMLSEHGKIATDNRTNSLILTDNQDEIEQVRSFLQRFDVPPKQARIRVRYEEHGSLTNDEVSVRGGISGKGWSVGTGGGKSEGLDVTVRSSKTQRNETSEYFINVLSGSPAYILAGKEIIFTERWYYLCERYAGYSERLTLKRIESGFEVIPLIVGDRANLEITPRITHEVSRGRKESIRFTEAATSISIPLGQWVTIGGTDETKNEVIDEILGKGNGNQDSRINISIMVE